MNSSKNRVVTTLLVLSVSLLSTTLSEMFLSKHYRNSQFELLSGFCQTLTEDYNVDRNTLMKALKDYSGSGLTADSGHILTNFGYHADDFTGKSFTINYLLPAFGFGIGLLIFLSVYLYWYHKSKKQIQTLTQYLEQVNLGASGLLFTAEDNHLLGLKDEIYKTVTALNQSRDAALIAKRNYSDNLYNIAHQLKTPITAISLSAQMIEEHVDCEYTRQIKKQIARLTHLEEALLLLSRIDAGTLTLNKTMLDVYTVLILAADNLQELSAFSHIMVDIPDCGQAAFEGDMEWTMEAVINLYKNCMEHSPAGSSIHCFYEQNPLYVQIRIWDEGNGFDEEDIPHLFERFYRGKHALKGGIGIGLSLSKAIIEMQNGIICAGNLPEGGAFFEIRIYSH